MADSVENTKTDEEKSMENSSTETATEETPAKTDDEKAGDGGTEQTTDNAGDATSTADESGAAPPDINEEGTIVDANSAGDKQLERKYSSDSFVSASSASSDKEGKVTAESEKEPEPIMPEPEEVKADDNGPEDGAPEKTDEPENENAEATEPESQPEPATDDVPEPSEPEETQKPEPQERTAEGGIDKESLEEKINGNEELQEKLESSLSNQTAERDAYRKLTEENARLQKHHDEMKEKLDDIEGGHMLLLAEVETLKKVNTEQNDQVTRLEAENKTLQETQGGDENVKAMQEKLIRLSNDQEDKDKLIHSLQGELDRTREQLKDAESRAERGDAGGPNAPKSKTCAVM